jgi:hypothetical protein
MVAITDKKRLKRNTAAHPTLSRKGRGLNGGRVGGSAVARGGSVKHISLVELYAARPHHSQEFGPEVRRPAPFGCAQGLP